MNLQSVLQIPKEENTNYAYALAAGNLEAAAYIYEQTKKEERREKIARVLEIKAKALTAFMKDHDLVIVPNTLPSEDVAKRIAHWTAEWKHLLLIDLAFASPLAPY